MKRVGIFAGTFDPIHEGHISFALSAKDTFQLDEIYFLVERVPRHKQNVSTIFERETRLKQVLSKNPHLKLLSLDDDQFSIVETVPKLEEKLPDTHFTLLIGSDVVAHSLPQWENLESLLPDVSLAIGIRDSHNEDEVLDIIDRLEGLYGPIDYKIIMTPHSSASSSQKKIKTS